jgi:hypothetical protein
MVTDNGYRLGAWINQQRNVFKAGDMRADREARLRELPGWTFDTRADQWKEAYQQLLDYVAETGSATIPQSYSVDGFQLGAWVGGQRAARSKGVLSKERERLPTVLPGWTWNSRAGQWDRFYALLQQYVKANGSARVPG